MKKFMKGAAITGGILFLIGLILLMIGVIGGGVKDMRQKSVEGLSELCDLSGLTEIVDKIDGIEIMDGVTISFGGSSFNDEIFENGQEKYTDGTYTFEDVTASDLEIVVGAGSLKVKYHTEPSVKLEIGSDDRMQCFVENDTLKIIGGVTDSLSSHSDMTVYLPEGTTYKDVLVDVGAGNLVAETFFGEDIVVDVGMGNVVIEDIVVRNLDITVGMGNVEIEGAINEDAIIDCGMGQVTMDLVGSGQDFDYELDCGMGALDVEGVCSIAGIGDQSVDNGASKEIEVSVGMGSVEVKFNN